MGESWYYGNQILEMKYWTGHNARRGYNLFRNNGENHSTYASTLKSNFDHLIISQKRKNYFMVMKKKQWRMTVNSIKGID